MPAIEILVQDNALLAVKKDAGVLPVHRLDRETAGVMIFAKNPAAAASLAGSICKGVFQKEYLAILSRPLPATDGVMEDLLFFDRRQGRVFPVKRQRAGVKVARLSYRAEAERNGLTLVRVWLETGRTHQIRAQFAFRGAPLRGDGRYGGGKGPLYLFCRSLSFPHPQTGRQMSFSLSPGGGIWDSFCESIQNFPNENTALE